MKEELKRYEVEPDAFWQAAWGYGDGYGVMEQAERTRSRLAGDFFVGSRWV